MILVSMFFSEDNVLSDEMNIYIHAMFSNTKVYNKHWAFRFFGTPGIWKGTLISLGIEGRASWSGLTQLYLTLPWSVKVASEDIWVHREVIEQKRDMQAGKWKVVITFLQGKKIPSQWICLACYSLAASLQSWACSRLVHRILKLAS